MMNHDIVIVGAGHGGAQAAVALRQQQVNRSIALLGDEDDPPYERPPLSKDYLAGDKSFERILIRPVAFWVDRKIDLRLGTSVRSIDAAERSLTLADGSVAGYKTLIWATGGAPRRLVCSGHDLAGVHAVRNRADVDRLVAELPGAKRIIVIGGGYIGLEAAASLTKLGRHVTVLEAMDRVLARVAGEPLSRFFEDEHRAQGVEIRLGATVDCILERAGRAAGVRLADGETLDCEIVIVGIGIVPAVAPLLAAGAVDGGSAGGVLVDDHCRTSLADIFAIGDCAAHSNAFAAGRTIRLESVQNANDQAVTAARSIAGAARPYHAVPWFWSNQYDLKLQTIGLSIGHDTAVVRGDPEARSFSIIYLREGRVIALDCVNSTKDYVQGRALVERGLSLAPSALAATAVPLRDLATEASEGAAR